MRLSTILAFTASYVALSVAQGTSSSGIFTILPITSIASTPPPLTEPTRTSTRVGGSQVQPTSFTTSRRTISDASTDRPPPSSSSRAPTLSGSTTTTATSPAGTASSASSASSAAASATTSAAPNTAAKPLVGISAGVLGVLAALGGAILV